MELITRIIFGLLLLVAACPCHLCTERKGQSEDVIRQLWAGDGVDANEQNEETPEELDLTSTFGEAWKSENKPISDDEFDVVWNKLFGENVEKGPESNTQSNVETKTDKFDPQSTPQNENTQVNEAEAGKKHKEIGHVDQDTNEGENDITIKNVYHAIWPDSQSDVKYNRFDNQGRNSPIPVSSSGKPEGLAGCASQGFPAIGTSNSKGSEVNSKSPSYQLGTYNGMDSISSNFRPEQVGDGHISPSSWLGNQGGIPETNPSFMYNYQRHTHPNSPYWIVGPNSQFPPKSSLRPGNQDNTNHLSDRNYHVGVYQPFWPGGADYAGPNDYYFRPNYYRDISPYSLDYKPHDYHYHNWVGHGREFQCNYQPQPDGYQWYGNNYFDFNHGGMYGQRYSQHHYNHYPVMNHRQDFPYEY